MSINTEYFYERKSCPVCNTDSSKEFFRSPLSEGPVRELISDHYRQQGTVNWSLVSKTDYVICECQNCRLIYQKHVPTMSVLEDVYTRWIANEGLTRIEHDMLTLSQYRQISGEFEILFNMIGKKPGDITFLDYGFGHGRWARVARGMGAKVYATEIGDDKPRLAATLGVEMISEADIQGMKFDIVHTEQVFEHLTEPAETFRRLATATGGIFKMAVPRHFGVENLLKTKGMPTRSPFNKLVGGGKFSKEDMSYIALLPLEHLNTYSRTTADYLAKQNGMTIVSRTRQRTASIDTTSIKRLGRSLVGLGKVVAKQIQRDSGDYWIMRPARA